MLECKVRGTKLLVVTASTNISFRARICGRSRRLCSNLRRRTEAVGPARGRLGRRAWPSRSEGLKRDSRVVLMLSCRCPKRTV